MTSIYENIIWPSKYVHKTYTRSKSFPENQSALKTLYQFTFDKHRVLSGCAPLNFPFSQSIDLKAHRTLLAKETQTLPLSIVTISRNDNHVERMEERTQSFINCIYHLSEKYQKNVELIIVEWNPPNNKPLLKDAYQFKKNHPYVSVVIIRVPSQVHQMYELADSLPLYQMIGKNVGIRRARGKFVLATNIDVLLSDELFQLITAPSMKSGKIYRSNRWDIDRKVLDLSSTEEMLKQARSLCFQINYADGIRPLNSSSLVNNNESDTSNGLAISRLHTWACGDFQLTHRDDWAKLAGYSELDAYSFHIDSLFAITCQYADLEEVSLSDKFPHYHIDHTLGTPIKSNTYIINEKKALYHMSYMTLLQFDYQMKLQQDYFVFNSELWGLAACDLPVDWVTQASWEQSQPRYSRISQSNSPLSSYQSASYLKEQESQHHERYKKAFLSYNRMTADYLKSLQRNKKFYIWGAGERGKIHGENLIRLGITIEGFIHGSETKAPNILLGLPVIKFNQLKKNASQFFLIASIYAEDIRAVIEHDGAIEGQDYLVLS